MNIQNNDEINIVTFIEYHPSIQLQTIIPKSVSLHQYLGGNVAELLT
jgi:hypothetical protein